MWVGLLAAACLPPTAGPVAADIPTATWPPTVTPPRLELTATPIGSSNSEPAETPIAAVTASVVPSPAVPLRIHRFSVSPAEIQPGELVTLEWDVSAAEAHLYRLNALGQLSESLPIGLTGRMTLETSPEARNQIAFVLVANSTGASAQAYVSVRVLCPETWFFANPPGTCPAAPVVTGPGATQDFQHGKMVWLSWNQLIYVLFDDGRIPAWVVVTDQWQAGMRESDPSTVPPDGLVQPVRGFGWVWRDESGNFLNARNRLGWGLAPERTASMTWQCDSAPRVATCYVQAGSAGTLALLPEGSDWFTWTGPTATPPSAI